MRGFALVALIQVLAYPLLLWLVWIWLGIPESSGWQLLGSAVLAVAILAASSWLLAVAFAGSFHVRSIWIRSLVFLLVLIVVAGGLAWRTHLVTWGVAAVITATILPLLIYRSWRPLRSWRYWLAWAALILIGGFLPWKLVTWVPATGAMAAQALSMAVRFLFAYLVSVAALLGFAYLVRSLAGVVPNAATRAE
jgi:hypothetical protein